jgi:protocatechuate 3,4-dioxygenase beta subunit
VAGTISGTVTQAGSTTPIVGATVSYSGGSATATTDNSGAYTLSNIAAGTYTVTASATGYQSSSQTGVGVTVGTTTTANFSLTLSPTTGTIGGTVTQSGNTTPIAGATVSYSGGSTTATTDTSGAYTLSSITPGTYTVSASAAGYQTSTQTNVTVTAGNTTAVNFALTASPATGTISGTVTISGTTTPVAGATVSFSGGSTTTAADGTYTFTNVSPGAYPVSASATGYQPASQSVSVTAGATSTANFAMKSVRRVNAGGASITDGGGNFWQADTGYNSGTTFSTTSAISAAVGDPRLYQVLRYTASTTTPLTYTFANLPNGTYTVNLYFAEIWSGCFSAGCRLFNVTVQGTTVLTNLDVYSVAGGGNKGIVETATAVVSGGTLTVSFSHVVQNPMISAIEILQQ